MERTREDEGKSKGAKAENKREKEKLCGGFDFLTVPLCDTKQEMGGEERKINTFTFLSSSSSFPSSLCNRQLSLSIQVHHSSFWPSLVYQIARDIVIGQ